MKNSFRFLLVMVFVAICALAQAPETGAPGALEEKARELVTLISSGEFERATANFDSTMKAVLPVAKLEETWKALLAQVGQFKSQGAARQEKAAQYDAVLVRGEFEKMPLDIKVVFNDQAQVAGLFFAPAASETKYESPSYVDPKAFRKTEVTIGSDPWSLPGTLTMPWGNQQASAVVLVHGSGPIDRDETIGPNKPFRDLAEGLSSRGIAVLRYDKRTLKYGEKIISMFDSLTVKEETVDDALAAAAALRRTPGIDTSRIFILGHSLGGTLVPRIAEADTNIAGFIIMAGMARPFEDAILDQYTYIFSLDDSLSNEERAALDTLKEQVARVKSRELTISTPKANLPLGVPAAYWLDLRGYQPADLAQKIERPLLIMQGGRDYQVTEVDFGLWQNSLKGAKNVETKLYPELNHLFIAGQGKITPDEYSRPGHVAEQVIDDIAVWVKGL